MDKKISHIEIYYNDSSMERIDNEEMEAVSLSKKQKKYITDGALNDLNNFRRYDCPQKKITAKNYKELDIDYFSDMEHSHFQMCISLLDSLL